MLRIGWNKDDLEKQMKKWSGISILDYWIPLWVYVDEVEISGLKNIPGGNVTHISTFFPELLSVIKIFDWSNLGDRSFSHDRINLQDNDITGGGFKFTLSYDPLDDKLIINYLPAGKTDWQKIENPLKEYAEGALKAVKEMISDIERIAPEKRTDNELIWLKVSYNTIRNWYEVRYHIPVEEKYMIPEKL